MPVSVRSTSIPAYFSRRHSPVADLDRPALSVGAHGGLHEKSANCVAGLPVASLINGQERLQVTPRQCSSASDDFPKCDSLATTLCYWVRMLSWMTPEPYTLPNLVAASAPG
jgi:hypothetical protein